VETPTRPETDGIRALVHGIALAHADDHARVAAARPVFDGLHAFFANAN
jgi:hypothetical protein